MYNETVKQVLVVKNGACGMSCDYKLPVENSHILTFQKRLWKDRASMYDASAYY